MYTEVYNETKMTCKYSVDYDYETLVYSDMIFTELSPHRHLTK